MDCDTSGIILSEATEISLSTKRVLAILLKPVDLMPAEDVVHFAHLTRPVLMLKPPNMSKITKLKGNFSAGRQTGGSPWTFCKQIYCFAVRRECLCKFNV